MVKRNNRPFVASLWSKALRRSVLLGILCLSPGAHAQTGQSTLDRATVAHTAEESSPSQTPRSSSGGRTTVRHRVVPFETLTEIAQRYGVTVGELKSWNKVLRSGKLNAGWTLKVRAKVVPPPRAKIRYVVKFGDTWAEIAAHFNVGERDLRRWNSDVPRQFKAGTKITVYTNPKPRKVLAVTQTEPGKRPSVGLPEEAEFDVPEGGISVGKPNRGKLIGGIQLPPSELYTVRRPEESWGSTHTVTQLQRAIAAFREQTGYDRELLVGAISLEHGGRFRPHQSHQSGRDIDLRLPKRPGADPRSSSPADIDWDAAWHLVRSFVATGEIEYIFLDYNRQQRLYSAAKRAGATSRELSEVIQYPRGRGTNSGVVRHAQGHLIHMHIRVKCPAGQTRCES